MLDILFDRHGYPIVSTRTAMAVPALIQHHPALLILDLRMEHPDSGWQRYVTQVLAVFGR